jgi:hypothetical protein
MVKDGDVQKNKGILSVSLDLTGHRYGASFEKGI